MSSLIKKNNNIITIIKKIGNIKKVNSVKPSVPDPNLKGTDPRR